MSVSKSNQIREIIKRARADDGQLAQLNSGLQDSISRLHGAIRLPPHNAREALASFSLRYIEHVPDFIDTMADLIERTGIRDSASVFLSMAEDFFLKPPDLVREEGGLRTLMKQAYLAHRLIEEVNDHMVSRSGLPLAPVDMTRANLIMHQLIGEPLANDLDLLVLYATEKHINGEDLMDTDTVHRYQRERRKHGWQMEPGRWPCLAEDLSIDIAFGGNNPRPARHSGSTALH